MLNKLFTNSAITAYGPNFPTSNISDGTIFYKTEASGGFNPGFYIYRSIADSNTVVFGPQPSQGWASADVAGLYVKKTGDTMSGTLELVDYLKISSGTTDQRLVIGNTSTTLPTIINSKNKVMSFGLGASFTGNGGTLDPWLTLNFTDATNGIKWKNQKVWHAGNDGTTSGLDADLLDGYHATTTSVVPNSIPARDADKAIHVHRVNLTTSNSENANIDQFITTIGTDGYTKKSNRAQVSESIRTYQDSLAGNRKTWNINISGSAASASSVTWNNVTNKPSWLADGLVTWDDIRYKQPSFYRFTDGQSSPKPLSFTNKWVLNSTTNVWEQQAGLTDSLSGFYAVGSSDFPRNDNTLADPNGSGAWQNMLNVTSGIATDDYWIGMQVVARGGRDPNPANAITGALPAAQLAFHWDAENGNVEHVAMAFRINDDDAGALPTDFSQWYKVWTNASLRNVSQLFNDAEYVSGPDIGNNFLNKTMSNDQTVAGKVEFSNGITVNSLSTPGNIFKVTPAGNIELFGSAKITTTNGHFETTNGHHYSANGRIWTDGGLVGTGTSGGSGTAFLMKGYSDTNNTYTGGLRLTNSDTSRTFGRIMGNITGSKLMYHVDPDPSAGYNTSGKFHEFNATIKTTGDVVAYASDERLKLNITPISNAIEKVKIISGVTFDWDMEKCASINFSPANQHEHGLIAQRVQEVMPDAVTQSPASDDYLTVRYERIVSLLTAAVTDQQTMIEQLQREVQELKNKLS